MWDYIVARFGLLTGLMVADAVMMAVQIRPDTWPARLLK
jgi:hypothetical protein